MKSGPIIVVEDDIDDKEVLEGILKDLHINNKLIWFTRCNDAFKFLKATSERPFLILSDVNIPIENGIEFKRRIDNDPVLRQKSIPFIFYSTSVNKKTVTEAYSELTVQGFFQKGNSYEEIKADIKLIVEYWKICKHPNSSE
jgi:CheY-like chemotaxis protein